MSMNYYLRRKEPMEVYAVRRVAVSHGCHHAVMTGDELDAEFWDKDGFIVPMPYSSIINPPSIGDIRILVDSGDYELVDEYGRVRDVKEVFGV